MAKISELDAVKIRSRVMIPVIKALEAEFGKEKVHAIVGKAIAESYADFVSTRIPDRNTHPGETSQSFDYPVEPEVVEHTDSSYFVNMTRCVFADYFRKIVSMN
ncbi:MAG: L-2-amino-thiazoline-4-carboxylic acid hydrolase [Pseudomonadota bacterium]